MFHVCAYNAAAAGVNAVNTDMLAVSDTIIQAKNGHFIFTENWNLLATALVGASVTRARYQSPHWNALGEMNVFNANRALNPPSNPQYDLYEVYPMPLPQNEEFQVQVSNNLGAATEQENAILLLTTPQHLFNVPRGQIIVPARATFAVTPTINVWSGPQALTLSSNLRGGVYSIIGAVCQGANAAAFRFIFPRSQLYNGRAPRPGWLTQTAIGDVVGSQFQPWVLGLGEWGRFHTFELPSVEVLGTTAGAITYQLFMWLLYQGENLSSLNSWAAGQAA